MERGTVTEKTWPSSPNSTVAPPAHGPRPRRRPSPRRPLIALTRASSPKTIHSAMHRSLSLDSSLHGSNLYDTRDGRVFRCECCGRIQIEFRGLSLLIDAQEFEGLFGTLVRGLEERSGDEGNTWQLTAPTDAGEVSVSLTLDELQALYELCAGAQAMRTLGERLGALANGHRRERPPSSWRR